MRQRTGESASPVVLRSRLLSSVQGLVHGFTTRSGGCSQGPFAGLNTGQVVGDAAERVAENLRLIASEAGLESFHAARQVHGTRTLIVDGDSSPIATGELEYDALATRAPGTAVAVRTADCVPILMVDPVASVVVAVHAGWRGTVAGVVGSALSLVQAELGVDARRVLAVIGPCIGSCCYEVGADVAEEISVSCPDAVEIREGRAHVNLSLANGRALLRAGVLPANIDVMSPCTACDRARFFSHRRDQGVTGRHLSYIALHGPEAESLDRKSRMGG